MATTATAWAAAPVVGRRLPCGALRAALVAASLALVFETANVLVLPRLYPVFHGGLSVLAALLSPVIGRGVRSIFAAEGGALASRPRPHFPLAMALGAIVVSTQAAPSSQKLALADNLRVIFLDRAPLLAFGVELGQLLAPPPPLEPPPVDVEERGTARHALDWRERDVLLVSVDALRADHVGAYGYTRATTPHIDALAREGTLFLRAYCPTPHTSYSITSMMTGKNMRPLLAQGLGLDSDTFAGLLRTYGYRTAAFYPPAVFFIDEDLFAPFRDKKLDFEYARVEFADPAERAGAVRSYLETQPQDRKVFVWVHLFDPHEPYVAHPEHPFGDRDIDRYDSEIAAADEGIGAVVAAMRARRPNTVVIVTADHGEEFGEHRGRYHGTTVYEEQVRVPLVIVGPGVPARGRVETPAQTIDVLPTVLGALDVPLPPRIRGHDLGAWLSASRPPDGDNSRDTERHKALPPPAFAETDEYTLLADAEWRLVCARRASACSLYNLDLDPGEAHDASAANMERFAAMKALLRRLEASHGHYERTRGGAFGGKPWPEAIRRGLAGDGDAAKDVAGLLDDSDVLFRRKAAEVLFDLKRKEVAPDLRLALSRDDDDIVRRWCALALTRLGEGAPRSIELLDDPDVAWRRLAALALAENGDARGSEVLVSWWQTATLPYPRAREVLSAFAQIRPKEAASILSLSLGDVRLRPYVAETLAAIGQSSSRGPLAERLAAERYQTARVALAEALLRLGAKNELVG
ncbi:MAG TPA: sulfatase-like hydrolase/transferase, partial [Polyangiaceae bacterium]|nr:sulfatase-like hydrolase/transferase [Polyangiaceae bacterium]